MSHHFEKTIATAQAVVAKVGHPQQERTEPLYHHEIESFVKGFGLSAAATARLVNAWAVDSRNNYSAGHDEGYDSGYEDGSDY